MNTIRHSIEIILGSPMQEKSFANYLMYANEDGKITAKSYLDLLTVIFTYLEEEERKNLQYEADFKDIMLILEKLTSPVTAPLDKNEEKEPPESKPVEKSEIFRCDKCDFVTDTRISLLGHSRKHKTVKK